MQWLERELSLSGLANTGPCMERVRIYSEAFAEVMDVLPTYRPFLLAVQKEYDAMIHRLQSDYNAVAPLEGRLKTMRAESLSFVGESMTWFQMEIDRLRRALGEAEGARDASRAECEQLRVDVAKYKESSKIDKAAAAESHSQNMDILKHLERFDKQVEQLRKQEKELHGEVKELERKLGVKESRIQTMARDLDDEREKLGKMVPKEELEAAKEEIKLWQAKTAEWQEMYAAKEKDYLKIVDTYSKKVGGHAPRKQDLRPLTPRPTWLHCHGLLEPDAPHSVGKAELAQQLLQRIAATSRTLLSAYGLDIAAQRSTVFQKYATHKLAAPLHACGGSEPWEEDEDASRRPSRMARGESQKSRDHAPDQDMLVSGSHDEDVKEGTVLEPDIGESTPPMLRHIDPVKNLSFSRKKVSEFLDEVMARRSRIGSNGHTVTFIEYMMNYIKETHPVEEEAFLFAVNIYAAVLRFSAEPDFLGYLLLILGKIPEAIYRDNKQLCGELMRLIDSQFEPPAGGGGHGGSSGNRVMTKQTFFYRLKEVLPSKDPKMWQDLVTAIPPGGPDVQLHYERLLLDDAYVLSPVVYALRLQHLEEVVNLADELEKTALGAMPEGSKTLKYGPVEQALRGFFGEDSDLTPEDFARAFGVGVDELDANTEQDVGTFMELMKTSELFHEMFFPALHADDGALSDLPEDVGIG